MGDKSELITLMGAMVIFSLLLENVNSFLGMNTKVQVQTELNYTAVALAQNIIDSARKKAFDEAVTDNKKISVIPDDFSLSLGPDMGETPKNYDDFDDYNNYSRIDTTAHEIYTTSVKVEYVTDSNYNQKSLVQTTHKKMIVHVISPSMKDTVVMSYVNSYHDNGK